MVHVAKRHAFAELVDNYPNVPVYPRRPKASIPCALHSMHPESGTLRVCLEIEHGCLDRGLFGGVQSRQTSGKRAGDSKLHGYQPNLPLGFDLCSKLVRKEVSTYTPLFNSRGNEILYPKSSKATIPILLDGINHAPCNQAQQIVIQSHQVNVRSDHVRHWSSPIGGSESLTVISHLLFIQPNDLELVYPFSSRCNCQCSIVDVILFA